MGRYDEMELRAAIARNGLNVLKLAMILGISRPTAHKKLKTGTWTLQECQKLIEILHLTAEDVDRIFFAQNVT